MSAVGWAQSPCAVLLNEAEKRFEAGDFEQVPELLEACMKGKTSRQERTEALELIAEAYVMSNRIPQARLTIEALLRVDAEFKPDTRRDPSRFIRLVEEVRRETATVKVASVSKSDESLREAPATVVVVTAEEIERRGYLDLEELLHDLPGFDISRSNGIAYSNVYQRGLRSDLNNRTLLLIDGVEENEPWTQSFTIGRAYPLSNVERVEVIYGPASTMYGANAFAGVINIITKESASFIQDSRRFGAKVFAGMGSNNTNYFDGTVAGRTENGALTWSLTSRIFRSDENDLSRYPDWDYDPAFFESVPYGDLLGIRGVDSNGNYLAQQYLDATGLGPSPYYTIQRDSAGTAISIELTPEGTQRVIELDQAAYSQEVMGRPIGFSDTTDDQYISAKLKFSNLVLGVTKTRILEGLGGWHTDRYAPGAGNGHTWEFDFTSLYAKYSRSIGRDLSLNFFGRYKLHKYGPGTANTILNSYQRGILGLSDLASEKEANWSTTYYHISSTQLRAELNAIYDPSEKFNLVSGIELRNGSIQRAIVFSFEPNPSETGFYSSFPGDNHLETTDLGVFAQASYKPREDFKVVLGGRFDHNEIRENLGFGTVFVPRLALVYSPGDFVFKAIYSKAFQPAANSQKYLVVSRAIDLPSPDLEPERIKNFELSASWQPGDHFAIEISGYESKLSDIVQLRLTPCNQKECTSSSTLKFQGIGSLEVRGIQVVASWKHKKSTITGNYTYTEPFNSDPRDFIGQPLRDAQGNLIGRLRVGDIADHQVNLQLDTRLWEKLNLGLRVNYVGLKRTGAGTTVSDNPFTEIDSYFVANAVIRYKDLWHGLSLQLVVNNLFGEEYYHPGIRSADGTTYAARIPQGGRTFFARLMFSF